MDCRVRKEGKSLGVITQNIDGLHEDAGSEHIDEIHGTLNRFYCINCGKEYTKSYVMGHKLRYCENCGDVIRPDIVLYGEMLDQPTVFRALDKIKSRYCHCARFIFSRTTCCRLYF